MMGLLGVMFLSACASAPHSTQKKSEKLTSNGLMVDRKILLSVECSVFFMEVALFLYVNMVMESLIYYCRPSLFCVIR
jgi:hypothetical protein